MREACQVRIEVAQNAATKVHSALGDKSYHTPSNIKESIKLLFLDILLSRTMISYMFSSMVESPNITI